MQPLDDPSQSLERQGATTPETDVPASSAVAVRVVDDPLATPAAATLRLYAGDWAHFAAWCRAQGLSALPASSATLAAYLLAAAPGLSRGALGRRRAAVGTTYRQAGHPVPLLDASAHRAIHAAAKPKAARQRL